MDLSRLQLDRGFYELKRDAQLPEHLCRSTVDMIDTETQEAYQAWNYIASNLGAYKISFQAMSSSKKGVRGKIFLDVGCGTGNVLHAARERWTSLQLRGIEFHSAYTDLATERFKDDDRTIIVQGDALGYEPEVIQQYAEADYIYLYRPIEDDAKYRKLIGHIYKHMKVGAKIFQVYQAVSPLNVPEWNVTNKPGEPHTITKTEDEVKAPNFPDINNQKLGWGLYTVEGFGYDNKRKISTLRMVFDYKKDAEIWVKVLCHELVNSEVGEMIHWSVPNSLQRHYRIFQYLFKETPRLHEDTNNLVDFNIIRLELRPIKSGEPL